MDTRDISLDVALASLVSGSPLTDRFLDNLKNSSTPYGNLPRPIAIG